MKQNKKIDNSTDLAILRTKFDLLISLELQKIYKIKKPNKSTLDYKTTITQLQKQLKNYSIKSKDLKINYLAFCKIRRNYYLKKYNKWVILVVLIVFIIVLAIAIPLSI
ncbi:hypothetical protein BCF59_0086 [Mycoplasmopsis mustelae]|uniref:Uncharacterized protein n=1 Tax=Mycoplasmopsis mustelae TaxID=171289 RepID=A0A4R7UCM7_9BACT|nr:hypothetical protein [Mycoplasmopsis mustelae]TDV24139.1 hypothetical protein BCF59_0086 [Mycoplasmopsis mustelae]